MNWYWLKVFKTDFPIFYVRQSPIYYKFNEFIKLKYEIQIIAKTNFRFMKYSSKIKKTVPESACPSSENDGFIEAICYSIYSHLLRQSLIITEDQCSALIKMHQAKLVDLAEIESG